MPVLDLNLSKPCALLISTGLILTITLGHDWSDFAGMHALEKEMAAPSSVLAWRIPGTEEPGGLLSMGSHRVGLPSMGSQSRTWLKRLSSRSSSRNTTLGHTRGKEPTCQCRKPKRHGFNSWVRKIAWRRAWQPTPVFLPGESHGQRSQEGYSPWGRKESDMTEASEACMQTLGGKGEREAASAFKGPTIPPSMYSFLMVKCTTQVS